MDKDSRICFIGCGNMGFALMSAVCKKIPAKNIYVTDLDIKKAHNAAASLGVNVLNTSAEAFGGNYVFWAVKPHDLPSLLLKLTPDVCMMQNVLISMAAGWSIKEINEWFDSQGFIEYQKPFIARIMPNTPALIGEGMIALSTPKNMPEQKIEELKEILACAGKVDIIDEHLMDAVTALSGSGPAFVCLFIEALADGAVKAGLPRDKALFYAAQTVKGAASMIQETGKHPGELKDMVASPGGTTIAGIAALEEGSFRGTVMKAVEAAWKRSIELS